MGFYARLVFVLCVMGATPMVASAMSMKEFLAQKGEVRTEIRTRCCPTMVCSSLELAPVTLTPAGKGDVLVTCPQSPHPPVVDGGETPGVSAPTPQAPNEESEGEASPPPPTPTTSPAPAPHDPIEANRTSWWVPADVREVPFQTDTDREAAKAVASCEAGVVEVYGFASETPEAAPLNPAYAGNRTSAGALAVRHAGGTPITDLPNPTGVGDQSGRGILFQCANGRKRDMAATAPGPAGPQGPAGAQGPRGYSGESGGGDFSFEVGLYGRPSLDNILDAGGGELTLRWETVGDTILSLQGGVGASNWGFNGVASLSVSWEVFDLLEIGPGIELWKDVWRDFVHQAEYQAALGGTVGFRFGGLRIGGFLGYGPNADREAKETDDQFTVTLTAGWVFGEETED